MGLNIKGYIWWSLLDNFEWDNGFTAPFGLVKVDYKTFKRTIKPFAYKFSEIIQRGHL